MIVWHLSWAWPQTQKCRTSRAEHCVCGHNVEEGCLGSCQCCSAASRRHRCLLLGCPSPHHVGKPLQAWLRITHARSTQTVWKLCCPSHITCLHGFRLLPALRTAMGKNKRHYDSPPRTGGDSTKRVRFDSDDDDPIAGPEE